MLSRQQQPQPRGDDRKRISRGRQAAEALFTSKPPVTPPAVQQIAPDPSARKSRVLRIIPPTAAARHDEPETPAAPTPPAVEIPPAQFARIRTSVKYGMNGCPGRRVYGAAVGEIERILGKA